jgi:hypothetical protein
MKKLSALVSSALVAVLVMTSPLAIAADARGPRADPPASAALPPPPAVDSAALGQAKLDGVDIVNTFYWGHCQESWFYIGETGCWCYYYNQANVTIGWLRLSGLIDCEYFKLAASSSHWLGIHWNSAGNIDYLRLWQN